MTASSSGWRPAKSSQAIPEEEAADRYYASVGWLSNQAQLKMWLIHHGSIQTAFRVQAAVDAHLATWGGALGEGMREIYLMGTKLAHDYLMREWDQD